MLKYRPTQILPFVVLLLAVATAPSLHAEEKQPAEKPNPALRWQQTIDRFEQQDREAQPAPGGVVFVGSSSIRMWDIPKYFPQENALNRGFGGSEVSDSLFYIERLVLKHRPRLVVMYAGDNDIGRGKTPEQITDDFRRFAEIVHDRLPETRILYVAVKPSLSRWKFVETIKATNAAIEKYCQADPRRVFIDVFTPMVGADGLPRKELLASDGLHMNGDGYTLWTSLIQPYLK